MLRRWLDPKNICWQYDWMPRDGKEDKHLETIHFPGNVWVVVKNTYEKKTAFGSHQQTNLSKRACFHAPSTSFIGKLYSCQVANHEKTISKSEWTSNTHNHTQMFEDTLYLMGCVFLQPHIQVHFNPCDHLFFRARVAGDMILFGSEINNIHETS